MLAVVILLTPALGVVGYVLPWVVLFAFIAYTMATNARQRKLAAAVTRMQDMVTLRHYVPALREAWRLLPQVRMAPPLHGQVVAGLTHAMDQLRLDEQAMAGYEYLLERLPDDHPAAQQIQVQRLFVALRLDQLTDADDLLRRLRRIISDRTDPQLKAQFRLAQLAQMIATHHHDDAVELADSLVDDLRPLGVEAGYGHGLLALAARLRAERLADEPDRAARLFELSKLAWKRATLLLPAATLAFRFESLREMNSDAQ